MHVHPQRGGALAARAVRAAFARDSPRRNGPPKLKLVTTESDLLPLLQFGEAVAVLMPARWVGVLRKKSNLDLKVTDLANTVELWSSSESVRALLEPKIKAWRPELDARLGVDAWK